MEDRCPECDRKIWHCDCVKSKSRFKREAVQKGENLDQFINKEHNKNFPDGKEPEEI